MRYVIRERDSCSPFSLIFILSFSANGPATEIVPGLDPARSGQIQPSQAESSLRVTAKWHGREPSYVRDNAGKSLYYGTAIFDERFIRAAPP